MPSHRADFTVHGAHVCPPKPHIPPYLCVCLCMSDVLFSSRPLAALGFHPRRGEDSLPAVRGRGVAAARLRMTQLVAFYL